MDNHSVKEYAAFSAGAFETFLRDISVTAKG